MNDIIPWAHFPGFSWSGVQILRRFNTLKQRVIQSLVNLYTRTGPKSLLSFNWVQPLKETSLLEGRTINSVINSPNMRRWLIKACKTNLTPRIDIKAEIDSKKSKKGILTSSTFASVRHFEFRKAAEQSLANSTPGITLSVYVSGVNDNHYFKGILDLMIIVILVEDHFGLEIMLTILKTEKPLGTRLASTLGLYALIKWIKGVWD